MPLPVTTHPLFSITLPSNKKKLMFRPFLVKEEKILLMAKQSDERVDKLRAVHQVITNCGPRDLDVDAMTTFDFDYVFMKLRAQSVDNMVKLAFIDQEDEQEYTFDVDLNKVEIKLPKDVETTITLDAKIKMKLKYPAMSDLVAIPGILEKLTEDNKDNPEFLLPEFGDFLMTKVVGSIYDDETVYDNYTEVELRDFIDQMPLEPYNKMREFLDQIPDLTHTITYTNSKGTKREIVLRGIEDFFTLD